MKKKKIYVFLTWDIIPIGGAQAYVAGKAKYLEDRGWKVYVCSFTYNIKESCAIPSLNKYMEKGSGWQFLLQPPYKMKKYEQKELLDFMVKRLNLNNLKNCEIIIESHDAFGYWGELLAHRVKARHFIVPLDEHFRGEGPKGTYEENLDFYYFKWKRNEIVAGEGLMKRLFNGYKNITKPLEYVFINA